MDRSEAGNADAMVPPAINTVPMKTATRELYLLQHSLETGPETKKACLECTRYRH